MAMSSVAGVLTSCLVNSFWEIPLVGGAGWLVCRGLRRLGPRVEHVVWVSSLLLAIVTPVLPLLRCMVELLRVPRGENEPLSIVFAAAQNSGANTAGVFVIPARFLLPLFVVYVGVLLYFAARLGWSLYWTGELLRGQPVLLGSEKEELWQRCRRAFGVD